MDARPAPVHMAGVIARPLGKMALALSGGGYRAAAFHLGTLRALCDLQLLDDVRVLSTASGGSIAGAAWVTSIVEGHRFERFEERMIAILRRNVVAEALDLLRESQGGRSLVQCAAEVYDGMFEGRRLGELADNAALTDRLDHVIVNATHFSLGYGFRFTFPPRPRGAFGNRAVRIDRDAWRDVRLADAVAASSCFPGGFEPIVFPDDFVWSAEAPKTGATGIGATQPETRLPLMDGGIYDNQAIDAVLLADNASEKTSDPEDNLGLLFCSDVDQKQMPYYAAPPRTPGGLGAMSVGLATLAVASGAVGLLLWAATTTGWAAMVLTAAGTLCGVTVLVLLLGLTVARRLMPFPYEELLPLALRLKLDDARALWVDRLRSVMTLTASVFMYRVRSLGYSKAHAQMPNRVVASRIYAAVMSKDLEASSEVIERAERARAMNTTLWMTEEERQDVVQTGYASAVGALVRYLRRWEDAEAKGTVFRADKRPFPKELASRVEATWRRVNAGASATNGKRRDADAEPHRGP